MMMTTNRMYQPVVLASDHLGALLGALVDEGYGLVGPRKVGHCVQLAPISGVDDLASACHDRQGPGSYRLEPSDDGRLFGTVIGPQSTKRWLFPPSRTLFRAHKSAGALSIDPEPIDPPKIAFVGLRPCDLAAIRVQDRVFGGLQKDPYYLRARERAFLVVVQCSRAVETCFCESMGTGPRAVEGFDLALTEITGPRHRFVVEIGSERGAEIASRIPTAPADADDLHDAADETARCLSQIERQMPTVDLYAQAESPRWNSIAERCLACGNCTLVCPTCFCSTVEDHGDLTGEHFERTKHWDSCFNSEFSYIHGGSVRSSTAARYRQWMTHKLAAWHEQFGTSGCVGCGRCIAWCPVGIDITEEARALTATPRV